MDDIDDYLYDDRTWMQKYVDDNTYVKDAVLSVDLDGAALEYWCGDCKAIVYALCIEGRNVWDAYAYEVCKKCGSIDVRDVIPEDFEDGNLRTG